VRHAVPRDRLQEGAEQPARMRDALPGQRRLGRSGVEKPARTLFSRLEAMERRR
jgi:hypothetical protein